MNKQIIIDGVQFNKWGDFLIDYELNGIYKTISSSDKCYKILKSLIEQLKHKEQECEELKEKLIKWLGKEGLRQSEKEFYEQQLDQLKAKHSLLKDEYKILEDNLDSRTRDFEDVIDGYKQTLADIKEIAESQIKAEENNKYKTNGYIVAFDILQKISECEVEDDNK